MGRLDQLQQTLPAILADNGEFHGLEIVLLDYGSRDGLSDWVKDKFTDYIVSGMLVYLRLENVDYYKHSHSRNVCFLASRGEIVCNVDADNFVPRGFLSHLSSLLHRHPRTCASFREGPRGCRGRLAMFRDDFLRVGGYDEEFEGWGYDDKDLRARLILAGCEFERIDPAFAGCLAHDDHRRVANMPSSCQVKRVTSRRNRSLSRIKRARNQFYANAGREWGLATLLKNFTETLSVGVTGQDC